MGNRFEKIDNEGVYSFRMVPNEIEREGFESAGIFYKVIWGIRPESLAEIDRSKRIKMFDEAIDTGNEFLRRYGKPPQVIRVTSNDFSDLVSTVAE